MAEYTKVFENPYPNGWEDLPSENTPITANALQEHTDAIENIEQYLEDNPIGQGGADVQWNQIQPDGTKIAEITIDGKTTDVFAPKGGGSGGGGTAETTTYDNSTSGLDAENVQDAIDEVSEDLTHKTMYGTRAEFENVKDLLPVGSSFDTTDESSGVSIKDISSELVWDGATHRDTKAYKCGNLIYVKTFFKLTNTTSGRVFLTIPYFERGTTKTGYDRIGVLMAFPIWSGTNQYCLDTRQTSNGVEIQVQTGMSTSAEYTVDIIYMCE